MWKAGLAVLALAIQFAPLSASADELDGRWLGPAFGLAQCGGGNTNFEFNEGSFRYVQNTHDCGGVSGSGSYESDGQIIRMHYKECSTCGNIYGKLPDFSMSYRMLGKNALQLCDYPPDGQCYTFNRD